MNDLTGFENLPHTDPEQLHPIDIDALAGSGVPSRAHHSRSVDRNLSALNREF